MPEAKENFRATETDLRDLLPNHSFDLKLLEAEIDTNRRNRLKRLLKNTEADNDQKIIENIKEIFGDERALLSLQETLSLLDKNIKCSLLAEEGLGIFALLGEKTEDKLRSIGYIHFVL